MPWNEESARGRIRDAWNALDRLEVKPLVRDVSLVDLPLTTAYRVDGVHAYLDIPNAHALLGADSEADHRKFLRFVNVLMRVAHLVFERTPAVKVDLQNTRLHFVVYKPYDAERDRVCAAVAIASVLSEALLAGNALHEELPDARVVIGIETGVSLAVTNGTRGDREALFLGRPANRAPKLTGPTMAAGIYLGERGRQVLGGTFELADRQQAVGQPLTAAQIAACVRDANLAVDAKLVGTAWDKERKDHPLREFQFSRWTPPFAGVDLLELTPANSRRQEMAVLFADIDGFTDFVDAAIVSKTEAQAIRLLHVMRKELRDVVNDFDGRKVRYIGDCIQAIAATGTAQTTEFEKTVVRAALCASALQSSFALIQRELPAAQRLGLAVGFEFGATAVTRVGVQGSRDLVAVSTASITAEREQRRCKAGEVAIGPVARKHAPTSLVNAFGPDHKSSEIRYDGLALKLERANVQEVRDLGVAASIANPIRPRAYAS